MDSIVSIMCGELSIKSLDSYLKLDMLWYLLFLHSVKLESQMIKGKPHENLGPLCFFQNASTWSNLDSASSWVWMAVWKAVTLCHMDWTLPFLSHSRLKEPRFCRLVSARHWYKRNSNISTHVLFYPRICTMVVTADRACCLMDTWVF